MEKKSGRIEAEEWIHSNAERLGEEPRFFQESIARLK